MKIVILHQHFNTPEKGGPLRSYYLAKALADNGYDVRVITAHGQNKAFEQAVENFHVTYLPVSYDNRFGFYRRVASFLNFSRKAVKAMEQHRDAKLCYAMSVPLTIGIAAIRIKSRYGIPYIFEVGDLWPRAAIELGFIKNPLMKKSLEVLERRIYRKSVAVVGLSDPICEEVAKKVKRKKIHLLPNFADTSFYQPARQHPEVIKKYNPEGAFIISYVGAIGFANGLEYLLATARAAQSASLRIKFIVCGNGAQHDSLKNLAREYDLRNVMFVPFQNRDGVREILDISDACFVCFRPALVLETGSPNKYFDALAAGKMVLINFGGWIKKEIEETGCGIALDPNDPSDLSRRIAPYLNQVFLSSVQLAARKLAEQKYSRDILSQHFVKIIRAHTTEG